MQTTILGRTNLRVSRLGMGGGGPSQLGRRTGRSESQSIDLLCRAFEAGVNFVDTSEVYGTEAIVGQAMGGRDRASLVISTKKSTDRGQVTPQALQEGLEQSLRRLGTDYIDVYNLHGVMPQDYSRLVSEVYPALEKARTQGKIRFVGITEMFNQDLAHSMLQQALQDDLWDVVMVGFNILNQTAREKVLEKAMARNVGVQVMFAVRRALSHPDHLREFVADLIQKGQIDRAEVDGEAPLGFLFQDGASKSGPGAEMSSRAFSLPDAAYRFCRDEPGVHVVLSGTGNAEHLAANLESFARPPLPAEMVQNLKRIFRNVDSTTGQ
jgi:aryl-alcohol dehydrogenase-like predicted oxidoreductase